MDNLKLLSHQNNTELFVLHLQEPHQFLNECIEQDNIELFDQLLDEIRDITSRLNILINFNEELFKNLLDTISIKLFKHIIITSTMFPSPLKSILVDYIIKYKDKFDEIERKRIYYYYQSDIRIKEIYIDYHMTDKESQEFLLMAHFDFVKKQTKKFMAHKLLLNPKDLINNKTYSEYIKWIIDLASYVQISDYPVKDNPYMHINYKDNLFHRTPTNKELIKQLIPYFKSGKCKQKFFIDCEYCEMYNKCLTSL